MLPKQGGAEVHMFEQQYLKLCTRQNCAPVASVKKQLGKKVLDFVADGVKLSEWSLLLKALRVDRSLKSIAVRSRLPRQKVLEYIDTEHKTQQLAFSAANQRVPVLFTKYMVKNIVNAVSRCVQHSQQLTSVTLECIPLDLDAVSQISLALKQTTTLKELALPYCKISDQGCKILCDALRDNDTISTLDLTACDITSVGAAYISAVLERKQLKHLEELWQNSLRYNDCDVNAMPGLRRLTLNNNQQIGDDGIKSMCTVLMDGYQLKALDVQACGLTQSAMEDVLQLINKNETMQIVDIRGNNINAAVISSVTTIQKRKKIPSSETKYPWLKEIPSNNRLSIVASTSKTSNKTIRSTQEPKKGDVSRKIQSDTALQSTKPRNVIPRAVKPNKSCDTVLRGRNNDSIVRNNVSQFSHITFSNGRTCQIQRMPVEGYDLDTIPESSSTSFSTSTETAGPSHYRSVTRCMQPSQPTNNNNKSTNQLQPRTVTGGGNVSAMPRNSKYTNKTPCAMQKISVPARLVARGGASLRPMIGSSGSFRGLAVRV